MKVCNRRKKIYRRCLILLLLLFLAGSVGYFFHYYDERIPDSIHISSQDAASGTFDMPSFASFTSETDAVSASSDHVSSQTPGTYEVGVKLLGVFPLKTVEVNVSERQVVWLGGEPIGLYLETSGVMIAGTGEVTDEQGIVHDPSGGLAEAGDYIVMLGETSIYSKDQLVCLVQASAGEPVTLEIKSGETTKYVTITPVRDASGEYKLGLWVRDNTQGIGTLTFITGEGAFGALGHGISDVDTGKLVEAEGGILYIANIWGIIKGIPGTPGGLCGMIEYEEKNELGSILKNTEVGIYGIANEAMIDAYAGSAIEIGYKQEITTGAASIYVNLEGTASYYDINIVGINYSSDNDHKGLILEVTDERLKELTGGIIQGMSGSPIIQNGRLVGAVTHVFVQDSTKGYGIFIEDMLEEIGG